MIAWFIALFFGGAVYGRSDVDTTLIHYRQGHSAVDPSWGDNRAALDAFFTRYREAGGGATCRLGSLRIDSYASPEGSAETNAWLSRRRADRLVAYLRQQVEVPDSLVEIRSHGVDWEGLTHLVATSEVPHRSEVLDLLRTVPEEGPARTMRLSDSRKWQLQQLRGGVPYTWMLQHLFPQLRRSCIVLTYTLVSVDPEPEKPQHPVSPETPALAVAAEPVRPAEKTAETPAESAPAEVAAGTASGSETSRSAALPAEHSSARDTFRPVFAVKTNLLEWATIQPDFHSYTFVPNLEIEWFFADRWSLHGAGSYAKWSYGGDKFFGLSAWSLEPRWWLRSDGRYRWLYIGVYGLAGDYDLQHSRTLLDGSTGKLWGAGLSVGAAIPFTPRLGLEIGLRGGYRNAQKREYLHEEGHWYLERAGRENHWGVTGVRVSLYCRFGKGGR